MKVKFNIDKTITFDDSENDINVVHTAFKKNCVESVEVVNDVDVVLYRWIRDSLIGSVKTEK